MYLSVLLGGKKSIFLLVLERGRHQVKYTQKLFLSFSLAFVGLLRHLVVVKVEDDGGGKMLHIASPFQNTVFLLVVWKKIW